MAFELLYLLREVAKKAAQNELYIPIESLKTAVKELLEDDNVAIYPTNAIEDVAEDLKELQKQSFLTMTGNKVIINKETFLNATRFVERQEELLKDDKYATFLFTKLKQRAQRIQLLSSRQ
jgi:hypothetical protein